MEVRFVIVAPASARRSFKVRLPVVLGRGDEAKFRIQQDSVSRQHCRFALEGAVVTVTDLGSTNGTHVAGTRIAAHAATAVPNGAEVRIGGTVLRVEYASSSAPPQPVPVPHDADTVPLLETAVLADEPAAELPEPEPAAASEQQPFGEALAAHEAPAATGEAPAFMDLDPAPPPAEGSFDFFESAAAPPPAADGGLDDFFKSQS